MQSLLEPGIPAPEFSLPAGNRESPVRLTAHRGSMVILLFFPAVPGKELAAQVVQFQQWMLQPPAHPVVMVGVSDAPRESLRRFAAQHGIEFALSSDSEPERLVASQYGVCSEGGLLCPTLFLIDEEGLIRRVYGPDPSGRLANPAAVGRTLNRLPDTPKPAPITQEDWQLGAPGARVTLIEYSDYECSPCRAAHHVLKEASGFYGDALLLVHRHYLLRHTHPHAQLAAEAAEAAGAQGRFWEMHDQLFGADLGLEREHLLARAQTIGLEMRRFVRDMDSRRFENIVNEKFRSAVRDKVRFPPALFLNRILLEGPRTQAEICARIDRLLACHPRVSDPPADRAPVTPSGPTESSDGAKGRAA